MCVCVCVHVDAMLLKRLEALNLQFKIGLKMVAALYKTAQSDTTVQLLCLDCVVW